jgi:hypothetical protein
MVLVHKRELVTSNEDHSFTRA